MQQLAYRILEVLIQRPEPMETERFVAELTRYIEVGNMQPGQFSNQDLEKSLDLLKGQGLIAQHKSIWGIPNEARQVIQNWWTVESALRKD